MLEFQVSAILKKVFIVVKKKYDKKLILLLQTNRHTRVKQYTHSLSEREYNNMTPLEKNCCA